MTHALARAARSVALAAAGAVGAVALGAPDALANVPPPRMDAAERLSRVGAVFGLCYALTLLCEFLVVRASLAPRLVWLGPGRGRLLTLVALVNLVTLPLVFAALTFLGSRDAPPAAAIVAAEAIPFLSEAWLYRVGFRAYQRAGRLESVPPTSSLWAASLLANVVSVAAGAAVVLGTAALFD